MKKRIKKKLAKKSEQDLKNKFIYDCNKIYDSLGLYFSVSRKINSSKKEMLSWLVSKIPALDEHKKDDENLKEHAIAYMKFRVTKEVDKLLSVCIAYINNLIILKYGNLGKIVVGESSIYKHSVEILSKNHIAGLLHVIFIGIKRNDKILLLRLSECEMIFTNKCIYIVDKNYY